MPVADFSPRPADRLPTSDRSFEEVARLLKGRALAVCQHLLPGGRKNGGEYVCGGIHGGRGRSFSVNITEGVWKEFGGDGAGGSDLISLFAAAGGLSQLEAKHEAEGWLGLSDSHQPQRHKLVASPARVEAPASPADEDPLWWRSIKAETRHDYQDATGAVVACVYRFRHPTTGEKTIRPWNPATKLWEAPEGKRPVLFLQEVANATGPVVLVEGEKCADAIREAGHVGTTIMGGAQAAGKTDWSVFAGRDVLLWRDNDKAGEAWLSKCLDELRKVSPASARILEPRRDDLEGFDAADAPVETRRTLIAAALQGRPVVTGRPVLRLADWTSARFMDVAPELRWLVRDIVPMGNAALLAAMGDTGKGMMTLDLALKVAGAPDPVWGPTAMGATVSSFGRAVVLAAEDDLGTIHRRLERMDPDYRKRTLATDRLIVVPLPNTGGAMPLFRSTAKGIDTTDDFARLRDELLSMDDVKLVVIDPLAAFVHADLNGDAAAASFVASTFAALATETGAAVIVSHHMRKPSGQAGKRVMSPEAAREAIRGSSALVDGVRMAYALWGAQEDEARRELRALGEDWKGDAWINRIVRGAVVKANDKADRSVRTYVRDLKSGLLVDRTDIVRTIAIGSIDEARDLLVSEIADSVVTGHPFTHTGPSGLYAQRERLPQALRALGRDKLERMAQLLLEGGRLVKCVAAGSKVAKWLDVPGGDFAMGRGAFDSGAAGTGDDDDVSE